MMTKPKGKTPTLLAQSTGKPTIELVSRKSECKRCKENILPREKCFKIPKRESGFTNKKPYCLKCFREILEKTKEDIFNLEKELDEASGDRK